MTKLILTGTTALSTDVLTPGAKRVKRFLQASKAANTLKNYTRQWSYFKTFCRQIGHNALPATVETIADYITGLAEAGRRVSSIQVALASINYMHARAKAGSPTQSIEIRELMAGIRRELTIAPRKKAPVTLAMLRQIVSAMPDNLRSKRDRALLLCGWAGAFRRSELAALTREDVFFSSDKATVVLRRSKTDQESRGMSKQLPIMEDKVICPVEALRTWLDAAGIQSGVLFRPIDRWGHVRNSHLDGRQVARIIKRAAGLAGIDAAQLSGHSLRSGFITEAAGAGVQSRDIAQQTGHVSERVLNGYIQDAGAGALLAVRRAFKE